MEALIDKIVNKLQKLPASQLQTALDFVNSLDDCADKPASANEDVVLSPEEASRQEKQAAWQAIINETAGAWPDFPTLEEIRSSMGQDAPREPF